MAIDLEDTKARVGERLETVDVPGRHSIEVQDNEVTVTVTEVPFTAHGMHFKRVVKYHFTLQALDDGTYKTYWGQHDWAGEGTDRAPCKTEEAAATHAELAPALDWIAEKIPVHAK